jgi:hypothetical protein
MTSQEPIVSRAQHRQVAHATMDAYLRWRDECDAVWHAYGCWTAAGEADAAFAYQTYAAALDREQQASAAYAGLAQRVGELRALASGGARETQPERKSRVDTRV